MAAQQGRHELRAAFIGNVGEARARGLFGLQHEQVTGAADAARAVVQLLGLAPPRFDQVADGLVGRIRAHDDAEGELREADDVGEVTQRMPVRRLIVRVAQAVDGHAGDRVAVRPGVHHLRGGQGRAGPRLDVDDHLLAELPADTLAEKAQMNVAHAARGQRVVDRDGFGGLPGGLCAQQRGGGHRATGERNKNTTPSETTHDDPPDLFLPIRLPNNAQ